MKNEEFKVIEIFSRGGGGAATKHSSTMPILVHVANMQVHRIQVNLKHLNTHV